MASNREREELHKAIWSIADDLRGSVDGWDFKQYILGIMFYRYISENITNYINEGERKAGDTTFDYAKLKDSEAECERENLVKEKGFFIRPSELFCNVIKSAKSDNATFTDVEGKIKSVKDNLNEYLEMIFNNIENSAKGAESEDDFAGLFDDIDVNSNKLGATVTKRNEKLVKILDGIAGIKLGNYQDNNIDAFGDAYEFLMSMYASNAGKSGGEFYTPQEVSELLTRLAIVGKTSVNKVYEETQGNVIVIDNDTFKQQHPNFDELAKLYEKDVVKHVTPYSNRMTEAIISRLSDQGYNLVIEGTGRTTDVPIQTATMLQAKGYETKMYVMAVPKINSYLGTIERYETMYADDPMTARATPKQAHDIVVKNLPTNLETLHKTGLFSDIRLYNREGVKLYSSLETPSISPKETLERELNRKVSGKEIQPTLERIEQKMVQNQHQETPEFKAIQQKLESLQPPTPPIPKTPKLPGL